MGRSVKRTGHSDKSRAPGNSLPCTLLCAGVIRDTMEEKEICGGTMAHAFDFTVPNLGPAKIPSPIGYSAIVGDDLAGYVQDDERIIYELHARAGEQPAPFTASDILEIAGPREKIYFSPSHVHAGIVTCGGLCPGLNDVIRALVRCLWYQYGVRRITGIRYGYKGLIAQHNLAPVQLNPEVVDDIHKIGGTVLGSSRGGGDRTEDIVDSIERLNLNVLFTVGGDGTQKGALRIADELDRRNLRVSIIGIPKTIDNDFHFIQKSFGFETAVAKATEAVVSAHTEAQSAINGIGLVKLMGRESGFIAAHTALASHEANFVLIPEVPFDLEGPNGFFSHLQRRLERRNHAVIIVAEGAGQNHMGAVDGTDASGNKALGDIGHFLRDSIKRMFNETGVHINLKYIDPSYTIRSAVADPTDSVYCARLGNNAVHAAMAGKTRILISLVNNNFVHVPISVAVSSRSYVDPESSLWRDVLEATQQPVQMVNQVIPAN
jgi:6-phosphofructokinase 1